METKKSWKEIFPKFSSTEHRFSHINPGMLEPGLKSVACGLPEYFVSHGSTQMALDVHKPDGAECMVTQVNIHTCSNKFTL